MLTTTRKQTAIKRMKMHMLRQRVLINAVFPQDQSSLLLHPSRHPPLPVHWGSLNMMI